MLTPLADLVALRSTMRSQGLRMVLTNGVFDLLHAGHVAYLQQARALGDCLVVALNSDASVQAIKGPLRPLTPQADRAALLAALRAVDYVTLFAEPTAEHVVELLRPEVYVKGGDYAQDDQATPDLARLPEARVALGYGAEVRLLPYAAGRSTSELIRLIVSRYR
ncbi:rfaE bifunctional protein [Oscillochloris trichoides DG-6]|uniref:RfaE bifunctional protein n=1 Tax=Oscillochloris trichoides DG-6 TaxID=765420 RepID=E1IIK9_9CHLR|nr:adenylyltransferase/cytidyltransferase family protein [Oscillochloris trichoides]EFO78959.1 rfaE bifunctional protein [Oscillochloris trichoides DG-6]